MTEKHHCHHQHEHHFHGHHAPKDGKNLGFAFLLNLSFALIELIGGIYTNSVAVLSDALHDFGDCIALGIAWGLHHLSEKGRDKNFSYGYKRFSILGALISSVILIIGSIIIIYHALHRFYQEEPVYAQGMLAMAILGIAVNSWAAYRLKDAESLNSKAIMLHLLEDVLGWVAVFIGSILIWWKQWYWIDPLLSILIAVYILFRISKNLISIFKILLQAIPESIDLAQIRSEIVNFDTVVDVHDMHLWSLDGNYHILTAHVVLDNKEISLSEINVIKNKIETHLLKHQIEHSTLAFETEEDNCKLLSC